MAKPIFSASISNLHLGTIEGVEIEVRRPGTKELLGHLTLNQDGATWRRPRKKLGQFVPWRSLTRMFRKFRQ